MYMKSVFSQGGSLCAFLEAMGGEVACDLNLDWAGNNAWAGPELSL